MSKDITKEEATFARSIVFYRHWYIDEYDIPKCSQWQELDWDEYMHGWHRNELDMGDDNPLVLLRTETRVYSYCKETGNVYL